MPWPSSDRSLFDDGKALTNALGLVAQTCFLHEVQNTTVFGASGEMRGAALALKAGTVITSIVQRITSAAASLTLAKVAIYNNAYGLVASSASAHAAINGATGFVTTALSTPYIATYSGLHYFAALYVGTTPPTVLRAVASTATSTAYGSFPVPHFVHAGLADLPATAIPATNSNFIWFGAV